MEGLIIAAVVYFVISQIVKQSKKTQKPADKSAQTKAAPAPARPAPGQTNIWDQITEMMAESSAVETGEGEAQVDAEGCVGGSLPHSAHEGKPVAKPRPPAPVRKDRNAPGGLATEKNDWNQAYQPFGAGNAGAAPRLTQERMREAVVLAEVLSKPVSLRKRR